jgi:uncharacterized protein (DUF1778 family)
VNARLDACSFLWLALDPGRIWESGTRENRLQCIRPVRYHRRRFQLSRPRLHGGSRLHSGHSPQSDPTMTTLSIRVPDSLHRAIKELAAKDGYSMNQFLITAAAEKLSALETVDYLRHRAERANLVDFDRLLAMVPDAVPDAGDELPTKGR